MDNPRTAATDVDGSAVAHVAVEDVDDLRYWAGKAVMACVVLVAGN